MNNNETKKDKCYGVNCAYSLELKELQRSYWGNRFKDMEIHSITVMDESGKYKIYRGEGYNIGTRFVRHGKGREFWPNGKVRYTGAFVNDSACGTGRLNYETGKLCYAGEWWLNKWHGKGVAYRENGALQYDGTFFEGIINGRGRFYFENGSLSYEGEVRNGKIHGCGRKYNEDGTIYYEGKADMGNPDSYGRLYHSNGKLKYEGDIKDMGFSGHGRLYSLTGKLEYEGEFVDGKYCGQGRLYNSFTGKLIREGVFPEENEMSKLTEEHAKIVAEEDTETDDLLDHAKQVDRIDEEDLFAPTSEEFPPERIQRDWQEMFDDWKRRNNK